MLKISIALMTLAIVGLQSDQAETRPTTDPSPGQLTIVDKNGKPGMLCPLEGTKVNAQISGFGSEVTVVQTFVNPSKTPIEAVYSFPLPHEAAVNAMKLTIGNRVVEGMVRPREEARQIYETAKAAGQSTALLDQERPNIFTQSVANIMPGATVKIEIRYVQILPYKDGQFEFVYPMVVGPRFLGNTADPEKISPPVARTGSNIELIVNVEAGAPLREVKSVLHEVNSSWHGSNAQVKLKKKDEIPNRDFILRFRTATDEVQTAFVSHMDPAKGGFWTLAVLPPRVTQEADAVSRELIFVLDQSGSQQGFPIEQSKALTLAMLRSVRPGDMFNVITFSDQARALWEEPRTDTAEHMGEAVAFVKGLSANGGTQLLSAVELAMGTPPPPDKVRIVLFNTDGFVGDEKQIVAAVQRYRDNARMFTFGIGNSVNRFLIDSMSLEGRGDAEIVTLAEMATEAAARLERKLRTPTLANIKVAVNGVPVEDVLPRAIPDVFDGRPIVVYGRYSQAGDAQITVSGLLGRTDWSKTVDVRFGASEKAPAIQALWARQKVQSLTVAGLMGSDHPEAIKQQITDLGCDFGIMTEHTSFVAVESKIVNVGGRQHTVRVPVERADGVAEGALGDRGRAAASLGRHATAPQGGGGFGGGGFGSGGFGGGGGTGGGSTGGTTGTSAGLPATSAGKNLNYVTFDPSDNSIIAGDAGTDQQKFDRKVIGTLKKATGVVTVEVWLTSMDTKVLEALAKAGLKLASSDRGLKVVFGTCDAKVLMKLAKLEVVQRIKPMK